MEIRLLGPLAATHAGRPVRLGGPRQRAVLAALAMRANETATVSYLIDSVWETPPATPESNLRTYVAGLRHCLQDADADPTCLVSRPGGYLIRLAPGELDLTVFGQLAALGEQALRRADFATAADCFTRALALWRDRPLGDLPVSAALRAEVAGWEDRRLTAAERRAEALLELGQFDGLIRDVRDLVARHPFREQLWAHLMLALHRAGRRAEALEVFQQARQTLVSAFGVEPGAKLQDLHRHILRAETIAARADHDVAAGAGRPTGTGRAPGAGRATGTLRATGTVRTAGTGRAAGAGRAPLPRQLPPAVADFAGRAPELAELDALLARRSGGSALPIVAIDGAPGVGKTALALHFAHRIAGGFAGGQLYLNLHGFDPDQPPMPAGEALGALLRGLGADPASIPPNPQEQLGMYRSLLADRQVLVVLDNAYDSAQVRSLLPGSPSCLVLVTSRNRLRGLASRDGAHRLTLATFTPAESADLLRRVAGHRVDAEADAARQLARLCGYLPLALRIAAEQIAGTAHLTLSALAGQLSSRHQRLDLLATDDDATAIRAVFSWSYLDLDPAGARMFRLLSLHNGDDISTPAAAALADLARDRAHRILGMLAGRHLVEESAADRYRLHDLTRLYARERAAQQESTTARADAEARLLSWYLHTADTADRVLSPQRRRMSLELPTPTREALEFADHGQALAWCESERENLLAASRTATAAGLPEIAWQLPLVLFGFLQLQTPWTEWITLHTTGLAAARVAHHRPAEARILNNLGLAYFELRQFDRALALFEQSLALSVGLGDLDGQAATHNNLARIHSRLGRLEGAIGQYREALELRHRSGNRYGQATALTNIGDAYRELCLFPEALRHTRQALAICQEIADRHGAAFALHNLGLIHRATGEDDLAVARLREALTIRREIGDQQGTASTLYHLGDALRDTGQRAAAQMHWQAALLIFEQLGDPRADEIRAQLG